MVKIELTEMKNLLNQKINILFQKIYLENEIDLLVLIRDEFDCEFVLEIFELEVVKVFVFMSNTSSTPISYIPFIFLFTFSHFFSRQILNSGHHCSNCCQSFLIFFLKVHIYFLNKYFT